MIKYVDRAGALFIYTTPEVSVDRVFEAPGRIAMASFY